MNISRLRTRIERLLSTVRTDDAPMLVLIERGGGRRVFRNGVELPPDTPASGCAKTFVGVDWDDV